MILKLPAALARELADVAARLECEVEALALEGLRALWLMRATFAVLRDRLQLTGLINRKYE